MKLGIASNDSAEKSTLELLRRALKLYRFDTKHPAVVQALRAHNQGKVAQR